MTELIGPLVSLLYQIENISDDDLHPDVAVELMENVAAELQDLSDEMLEVVRSSLRRIESLESDPKKRVFVAKFTENFGLV